MRCASSQMIRSQSPAASSFTFNSSEARRHVQAHNQPVLLDEGIAGDRCFDLIAGKKIEVQAELLGHFLLPLFDEAAGRDNQTALQIAADQKLLDQQPGHDRLAGAGSSASRKRSGWRGSISP